jgi:hypothetical protein
MWGFLLPSCSQDEAPASDPLRGEIALTRISEVTSKVDGYDGLLGMPASLDFDDDGYLYVLDTALCAVLKLDNSCSAVSMIGRRGEGPGEFDVHPRWQSRSLIAVGGGWLFVASNQDRRMHVFTTGGEFVSRWPTPGHVSSLSASADGQVFICSPTSDSLITTYRSDGVALQSFGTQLLGTDNQRFVTWQEASMTLRTNGSLSVLFRSWPVLRDYRSASLTGEAKVDIAVLAPEEEELKYLSGELWARTPKEIARSIRTGESLRGAISGIAITIAKRGESTWGLLGEWLFELGPDARIRTVLISPGLPSIGGAEMTVSGGRVAIASPWSAEIFIGDLRGF